jgi:hypothetical protein
MENEGDNQGRKKRPGYLTAYANHARITKTAAAKQLQRVGVDYMKEFDFAEADRLRSAARHADRAAYTKPIYSKPREDQLGGDENDGDAGSLIDPILAESQRKKEEFRAKLVELEYEERVGMLVRKSEVEKAAFRVGRLVRDAVLNVPSRLAGILAAESDQRKVHDLLEKELRQALEALAIDDRGTVAA